MDLISNEMYTRELKSDLDKSILDKSHDISDNVSLEIILCIVSLLFLLQDQEGL